MGPRGSHDAMEKRKKLSCLEFLYRIRYSVSKIKMYPKKLNKVECILLHANVEWILAEILRSEMGEKALLPCDSLGSSL